MDWGKHGWKSNLRMFGSLVLWLHISGEGAELRPDPSIGDCLNTNFPSVAAPCNCLNLNSNASIVLSLAIIWTSPKVK